MRSGISKSFGSVKESSGFSFRTLKGSLMCWHLLYVMRCVRMCGGYWYAWIPLTAALSRGADLRCAVIWPWLEACHLDLVGLKSVMANSLSVSLTTLGFTLELQLIEECTQARPLPAHCLCWSRRQSSRWISSPWVAVRAASWDLSGRYIVKCQLSTSAFRRAK